MPNKTNGTLNSIQLVGAPFNNGPDAHNEYEKKHPVVTTDSNLERREREYLFKTFLVSIPVSLYARNSAFLFSIAINKANKVTLKINHGEIFKLFAIPPEIALNKKPEEMQKISKIGSFFKTRQYRTCIRK